MGDQLARGEDFEKKAEKKLNSWGLFGSKYEDAADLFDKAANCFKLAKSFVLIQLENVKFRGDKAGSTYVKLSNCHLKLESKHEAAQAYVDAAHCYKKTATKEAISCLQQAVNMFCDIGRLSMAARYYKVVVFLLLLFPHIHHPAVRSLYDNAAVIQTHGCLIYVQEIAELYESEQNIEQAIDYYEKAADFFQNEEVSTSANQCKQKVAQFAAQIEQYQKAIEIYEEIARQSLTNNLLKYGVKGHLLNAGICQLCKGDVVAITNALERYQELDPTFSGTRECKLLADIASAIDEEDVTKFTDVVKEFDSMTPLVCQSPLQMLVGWSRTHWILVLSPEITTLMCLLLFPQNAVQDSWKTTLLLRVKEKLKAKELEEDDLT
ncbi:hypothetical protein QQP08_013603 [Theobroma cacao]|nr:hypothetical protein QQP08_013603 [Theobroma cacao]